jgi:hypothetical protein
MMVQQGTGAKIIPFRLRPPGPRTQSPFILAFKGCDDRPVTAKMHLPTKPASADIGPTRANIAGFVFVIVLAAITLFVIRGLMNVPDGEVQARMTDPGCALHDLCGR